MERVVLVASLGPDTRGRVLELLDEQTSHPSLTQRQGVFLSDTEVIFFFEGKGAEAAVHEILDDNDPVRSAAIGPWLPLFEGPLHRSYEALFFELDSAT
jgi:hypothetical protein